VGTDQALGLRNRGANNREENSMSMMNLSHLQQKLSDNFANKYQDVFTNALKRQSEGGMPTPQDMYAFQMDMISMNSASQMSSQATNINQGISKEIINAIN
jgi:hypothetical protein